MIKYIITIVPSYTGKNITHLLPLALLLVLCTCNNTDGNKLVIYSGIAFYYGDNYIIASKVTAPQDAHRQFNAAGFPWLKHFTIHWYIGKIFGSRL